MLVETVGTIPFLLELGKVLLVGVGVTIIVAILVVLGQGE